MLGKMFTHFPLNDKAPDYRNKRTFCTPEKFSSNFAATSSSTKLFCFSSWITPDCISTFESFRLTFCCSVLIFFLSAIVDFNSSLVGKGYLKDILVFLSGIDELCIDCMKFWYLFDEDFLFDDLCFMR